MSYSLHKQGFINGQLKIRIHLCSIIDLRMTLSTATQSSKNVSMFYRLHMLDLLMAMSIVQEYIRILTF